jgi:hypothetical protein
VRDRFFYLDDVLLQTQTNLYHLYQIKHRQNPAEDYWNWNELLNQEAGEGGKLKDSLIQKWFKSWSKVELDGKIEYAAFATNGIAAEEIQKCLNGDKIDIEKIKAGIPTIYSKLKEQLVNDICLEDFFTNFRFLFSQKDIDALEADARKLFYEKLKATESGVTNLLDQIRRECRKQITSELTQDQIKRWCEFDDPRPLDEDFKIPDDFELFDSSFQDKILADLQNKEGGVKVIYGKPGSGKSTYISNLHKVLTEKRVLSIRHHYHISPDDPNPQERLWSLRVEEAIKAQFKQHSRELEDLAYQNSGNVPLKNFIGKLADYFYQREVAFVLIIDGLDHVLRYAGEEELRKLIREVCFPQHGLWIILGTQEIAKAHLPQIIFDKCPEKDWIEIKGLGKDSTTKLIKKNCIELNFPQNNDQLTEVYDKIYEITQGNPLHLRYILNQLKITLGKKLVTKYECNNLVPYGNDIGQYYSSLWRTLPESGKMMALLISCAGFHFKQGQLFEVMATLEGDPTKISEGYKAIVHLFTTQKDVISVFHNSFESFMHGQPEYQQQRVSIKKSIKLWLENSKYDELKWAQLRNLEYELGNSKPILEINRNWLIDAINFPREPHQVISQLELGARAAFENKNLGKTFELGNLRNYYHNAVEYITDEYEKIWEIALKKSAGVLTDIELSTLSSKQIYIISQKAEQKGIFSIIDESIDVLSERHKDLHINTKGEIGGELPLLPNHLLSIVTLDRKHEVKRVHRYITQFEESGWAEDLFVKYVDSLLKTLQFSKVDELINLELTRGQRQTILTTCAKHDLRVREYRFLEAINQEEHDCLTPLCLLYLLLAGKQIKSVPDLPSYDSFPTKVAEHETGKREIRAKVFSENFIVGLIYGLMGKESEVQRWLDGIEKRWALEMMAAIFDCSLKTSKNLAENVKLSFTNIFERIANVDSLKWPEQRELYELQICLRASLSNILKTLFLLKSNYEEKVVLGIDECFQIISGKYFDHENFLQFLLDLNIPLLSVEAYKQLISEETVKWEIHITNFPERAGHYADLAKLALIHEDDVSRVNFITMATKNLLGYGYHKDIFLYGVIESIELCHNSGSRKTFDWIKRLAPIVDDISEYTDGDETSHLKVSIAEILSRVSPELLFKYYYEKARKEDLFLAQDIFKSVIKCVDFNKEESVALATTALDKESLATVRSISGSNPGVNQALDIIDDYFGRIEYSSEKSNTTETASKSSSRDYSLVHPDVIEKHLASFNTRWDERDFLIPWAAHWLNDGGVSKKQIFDTLVKIAERDGLYNAEGDLLDILYPLAYEYENNKAFELLCWAQANAHGWDPYWTEKSKTDKRWLFVSDKYADRHWEFFEKSTVRTGITFGRGGQYSVPIPRSVEFLAIFSKLHEMEEIVEASVSFAESLMGNLKLTNSAWTELPTIDILDILLQRLLWPSALVRERAASSFASLLTSNTCRELVFERLIGWISRQQLESIIATGLLPILKAGEKKDEALSYLDLNRLAQAVPVSSIVIEKLIDELSNIAGKPLPFVTKRKAAITIPENYTPSKFFTRYIKSFLAPIYGIWAEKIEKATSKEFTSLWAYNAEHLIKEMNLTEDSDPLDFMGNDRSPILPGMSTMISEIYRTSFLRVLQYFYDQGLLDKDIYFEHAYATLPVDLSYWKVKPSRAPKWWPKLQHIDRGQDTKIQTISFEREINQILTTRNDYTILGFEGTVEPAEGWQNGILDTMVTAVAFGYRITGPTIPEAKVIADKVLNPPPLILWPSTSRPFHFLESHKDHMVLNGSPFKLNDILLYPLVVRNRDLVISLWQWFRDYYILFGLYPGLSKETKITIQVDSWNYMRGEEILAISTNWLEGLQERHDANMNIACGNYIQATSSFLNSLLHLSNLRLGYIFKTNIKYREHSYGDVKEIDQYSLFGVSPIITPQISNVTGIHIVTDKK